MKPTEPLEVGVIATDGRATDGDDKVPSFLKDRSDRHVVALLVILQAALDNNLTAWEIADASRYGIVVRIGIAISIHRNSIAVDRNAADGYFAMFFFPCELRKLSSSK